MKKPIIIVGAGIAGLSIAFQLDKRNLPYLIFDTGTNQCSKIAAGIINPIVFRRMALSWRIAEFLPCAKKFYLDLELNLHAQFFHSIPIRRIIAHQHERDLWNEKLLCESHEKYITKIDDYKYAHFQHRFGSGLLNECYWIDSKLLIDVWIAKLKSQNKVLVEEFNYAHLYFKNSQYMSNNFTIDFDKIIFCEGYHGINNPYFSYLPLQATKGEVLTVRNEYLPENESLNYKCFVLPIKNKTFKVGSTYNWNSPNVELTESAKNELINHLEIIHPSKSELIDHEAGVRPTVLDRRPLLGKHPIHSNLYIYNGLGAKGFLITPKLSEEFITNVVDSLELDSEVDIKRYEKLL